MRVSEHFKLDRNQPTLDFVDVDVTKDARIYLDPHALSTLPSIWAAECASLVQHFFRTIVNAIRDGDSDRARSLLIKLKEPNETHLGQSKDRSRGRALGEYLATVILDSLQRSDAVKTGLLEDLEDTVLMVFGVGRDIISDITTNILREPLIHYTQDACRAYGIPMDPEVDSGPIWNPATAQWRQAFVQLPTVAGHRLILVPKILVRQEIAYDSGEYYRHYILEALQDEELKANSNLIQVAKDGSRRITFKSLKEKYGEGKRVVERETLRNPELLRRYRDDRSGLASLPLGHRDLSYACGVPTPDWDHLIGEVIKTKVGAAEADLYEKRIEKLLTALMYPTLTHPKSQFPIHNGRKRIDITYTNLAMPGFFGWLGAHYPSSHVFVECKNYGKEIGNPELDQLSGRFSPSRGKFGILVCRSFDNKALFMKRCIDTAKDGRGFVIPIDDSDLDALVAAAKVPKTELQFALLWDRFTQLVS